MTPKVASRKENENKVWKNLYSELGLRPSHQNFQEKTLDKGYTQRWTEDVFKISKIQLTIPVTYKITDYNGEEI